MRPNDGRIPIPMWPPIMLRFMVMRRTIMLRGMEPPADRRGENARVGLKGLATLVPRPRRCAPADLSIWGECGRQCPRMWNLTRGGSYTGTGTTTGALWIGAVRREVAVMARFWRGLSLRRRAVGARSLLACPARKVS